MVELEVSRRVPLPKVRRVYSYPYSKLEIGDSFAVPKEDRAKVLNANYRASKRLGYKFSARTVGDVVRVWRTA
jgi:hypothetical protein